MTMQLILCGCRVVRLFYKVLCLSGFTCLVWGYFEVAHAQLELAQLFVFCFYSAHIWPEVILVFGVGGSCRILVCSSSAFRGKEGVGRKRGEEEFGDSSLVV